MSLASQKSEAIEHEQAPLVSVLVPVHNNAQLLSEALFSIYYQSYKNIEIIIVDDASTDPSLEIAKVFVQTGLKIQVLSNSQPQGFVETARKALAAATGMYVKFLMPQDRLAITAIERQVEAMAGSDTVVLSSCAQRAVGVDGKEVELPYQVDKFEKAQGIILGRIVGNQLLASCSNIVGELSSLMFARANVPVDRLFGIGKVERFDFLGPQAMILRLLATGNLNYIDEKLVDIRVSDNHIVSRQTGFYLSLYEWTSLVVEARRIGFLSAPRDEVAAIASAYTRIADILEKDPIQVFVSRIPDVLSGIFRYTERLYERSLGTRFSMILGHDTDVPGSWVMELSSKLSTTIELVLLERPGEMPIFSIAETMLPIKTMEIPEELARFTSWKAAVGISEGHFIVIVDRLAECNPEVYCDGVRQMRANPRCGLMKVYGPAGELSGVMVRKDLFTNFYGTPEYAGGNYQEYDFARLAEWMSSQLVPAGFLTYGVHQDDPVVETVYLAIQEGQ